MPDDSLNTGQPLPASPTNPVRSRTRGSAPTWSIPDRTLWPVFEKLNEREQRIIAHVAAGYSSKEIAELVSDTENAIEQVVKRIRAKCGGVTRREMMRSYDAWQPARSQTLKGKDAPSMPPLDGDRFPVDLLAALSEDAEPVPQPVSVHRSGADAGTGNLPPLEGAATPVGMVLRLPVGMGGSGRNELDKPSSTFMLIAIATVSVFFAAAILILLFTGDHLQIGH